MEKKIMNSLWSITIDQYLEVVKIAQADGVKPGESIEKYFIAYMKENGQKPTGATELTRDELIKEYISHGKSVLSVETKEDGKTQFKAVRVDK